MPSKVMTHRRHGTVSPTAWEFSRFAKALAATIAERVAEALAAAVAEFRQRHVGVPEAETVEERVPRRRRKRKTVYAEKPMSAPKPRSRRPHKVVPNRRVEERVPVVEARVAVAQAEPTTEVTQVPITGTEPEDTPAPAIPPPVKPEHSKDPATRIKHAFRPRNLPVADEEEPPAEPSTTDEPTEP